MPRYCLSAIRNPQLGRPRVLPLVLRAQVMRVCFIVFAARLVVIFWHFRQVVVVLSVVICDHGAAPCLALEAVCEASAVQLLANAPSILPRDIRK
jgi:hypothetical protein